MTRNSLVIFCIAAYIDLVLATNSCLMTNEVHDCVYTVECEHYAGSAPNPSCELEPYVTFVVKSSFVETLTAGFFGSTNFDSRVRVIEGKDNRWLNIEEATFRYFTKTQLINLSNNNIQNIRNFAFKNLVALQSLNLSKNAIETLSARSLMTVEGRDSEYLKMIDLSSNQIIFLSSEVFDHAPNLEELFLNNNNIKHIEDNVFGALSNLYRLTLQNNLLTSINMTLINLKSLIYLDLSYNNISAVFGYELNRLTSLQVINMTHNAIKTVDGNCFTQAFNLFQVDFSNNCIESELENIMFVNNAKLDYLTFENNNITKLHDGVFKHTALRYLNLEGNKIDMVIQQTTFSGLGNITKLILCDQRIHDLRENAFSDLKNLLILNLSTNRISFVHNTSFLSTSYLNVLDLSHNNIGDVSFLRHSLPNITELYLNDNIIKIIEKDLFFNHTLLTKLNISMNRIVTIEPMSLPLNSLQYLYLSGNMISGPVKKDVFSPAKLLRFLDLSNFKITKIETQAFIDMPVLTRLNISNNNIDFIDPDNLKSTGNMYSLDVSYNNLTTFVLNNSSIGGTKAVYLNNNCLTDVPTANLSELLYLDLSHNQISNVTKPLFQTFRGLRVLNLSHNTIRFFNNIYTNTLKELSDLNLASNFISSMNLSCFKDLVSLDISNNSLRSINNTFLQNLDYLQSLDISNNKLTILSPGTFQDLKILKLLNISSNGLTNLRYGTFKGLHRTEVLDLSRNAISDIDEHVFHECLSLKKLIIDYNRIKKFDIEKVVTIVPTLSLLSLGGNPIKCKEIVRSFNNVKNVKRLQFFITNEQISPSSKLEITSIDKVYHEDNVHGIKCGYDDETGVESSKQGTDPKPDNSNTSLITTVIVTTVLLTIVTISAITGLFLYRKWFASSDPYGESRLQMRQSIDLNGSDFRGDLLN